MAAGKPWNSQYIRIWQTLAVRLNEELRADLPGLNKTNANYNCPAVPADQSEMERSSSAMRFWLFTLMAAMLTFTSKPMIKMSELM